MESNNPNFIYWNNLNTMELSDSSSIF